MEKVVYDKEYFIRKFEAIPDNEIGQGTLKNHCALHHVGMGIVDGIQTGNYCDSQGKYYATEETLAFIRLFGGKNASDCGHVYIINDGNDKILQTTPKERILNKLRSLKNK